MSTNSEKPKIIIDEDWKSQVEAEKDAARTAATGSADATGSPETTGAADAPAESTTQRGTASPADGPLPPATLPFLLTTIGTQAMISLGQVPNPFTGKVELRPQQAKHYIDTLAMLEEKTNGNRTPEETTLLTEILHQLRLGYVMVMKPGTGGG